MYYSQVALGYVEITEKDWLILIVPYIITHKIRYEFICVKPTGSNFMAVHTTLRTILYTKQCKYVFVFLYLSQSISS